MNITANPAIGTTTYGSDSRLGIKYSNIFRKRVAQAVIVLDKKFEALFDMNSKHAHESVNGVIPE